MKKRRRRPGNGSSDVVGAAGEEFAHTAFKPRVVLNLAAPGAGKGTAEQMLRELLPQMRTVSMSNLLGERCRTDGGNVPDNEVNPLFAASLGGLQLFTQSMIGGKLVRTGGPKMLFIDGFPRSDEQARFAAELFGAHGLIDETLVLDWTLEDSLSLRRQFVRWVAESTKPADERRPDFIENPDKATKQHHHRLSIFNQNHGSIRTILAEAGFQFRTLDASKQPEHVVADFLRATNWMLPAQIDELAQPASSGRVLETRPADAVVVAA